MIKKLIVTNRKTVLIIDDDCTTRDIIYNILLKFKYLPVAIPSGIYVEEYQLKYNFDLIIVDIFMPEQDGCEIITKLREYFTEIKILVISGGSYFMPNQTKNILEIAQTLGADGYIQKPITQNILLETIHKILTS